METKPDGIHLKQDEADQVGAVFRAIEKMKSGATAQAVRQPSATEHAEATALVDHIVYNLPDDESDFVLTPDRFPVVRNLAELALENTQAVVTADCTSRITDKISSYHPEWRGDALRSLATLADLSERIRLVLPPIERA